MKKLFLLLFPISLLFLTACDKTVQSQMNTYMEFYYPTTGKFFYQITFDWGYYTIDTEAAIDEEVEKESEPYKGYITMRPDIEIAPSGEVLFIYVITPEGQVWSSREFSIPQTITRQVIIEEKTEYGTSTSTTTITSSSEPIIDHFIENPLAWKKYGELQSKDGKKFSLHLIEEKQ